MNKCVLFRDTTHRDYIYLCYAYKLYKLYVLRMLLLRSFMSSFLDKIFPSVNDVDSTVVVAVIAGIQGTHCFTISNYRINNFFILKCKKIRIPAVTQHC